MKLAYLEVSWRTLCNSIAGIVNTDEEAWKGFTARKMEVDRLTLFREGKGVCVLEHIPGGRFTTTGPSWIIEKFDALIDRIDRDHGIDIGDTVYVVARGEQGVITGYRSGSREFLVDFADGGSDWFTRLWLDLVSKKQPA